MRALGDKGIYVSTDRLAPAIMLMGSHVLKAMGLSQPMLDGAFMFQFFSDNTLSEIDYVVDCLKEIVPKLRRIIAGR